jgi:polyphosphate kinase
MKKISIKYFNRELNWLEFNQRVLDEAQDESVPLLERLKFLAITASNLDEFFMVRVGGLMMIEGVARLDPSGMAPTVQLESIRSRVREMVKAQYACFSDRLEPGLKEHGLIRLHGEELSDRHLHYLGRFFERDIFPVITPMALDLASPFPLVQNLGVNLLARMKPVQGETKPRFAVIPLGGINRFVVLPSESGYHYLLVEDLITAFIDRVFPGVPVAECLPFRITRNADFALIEDNAADLLIQMEKVLDDRKLSDCVRLEVGSSMSGTMLSFLQKSLTVSDRQTYQIGRAHV